MQPRTEIIEKLPEEVTIPELVGEIQSHLPWSTAVLFAQTSHYWRNYYFPCQQLEKARQHKDYFAQKKLLTDLIIKYSLLSNDGRREGRFWLPYLKKYYKDENISSEFPILAHALQLILDDAVDQRLWDEWVIGLNMLYIYASDKEELGYSLLSLVFSAMSNKVEMIKSDSSFENTLITLFSKNKTYDVYEAKIFLAVFMQNIMANPEDKIKLIISVYKASTEDSCSKRNFFSILHALIQLLPLSHSFWRNKRESAAKVVGYLSVIDSYDNDNKFGISFINELVRLMLTFFRLGSLQVHECQSWQSSIFDSLEGPQQKILAVAWELALEIYSLQDDAMRLAWLTKYFSCAAWNKDLVDFAYTISAQLVSDEARREATLLFHQSYWGFHDQYNYNCDNDIISILEMLLKKQLNNKKKSQLLEQMYIALQNKRKGYYTSSLHKFVTLISSLPDEIFLPTINAAIEKMERKDTLNGSDTQLFVEFFENLKAPENIKFYLTKLRQLISQDVNSDIYSENNFVLILKNYVALLKKQPDQKLVQELQAKVLTFEQDSTRQTHFYVGFVNYIVPFTSDIENRVKLIDLCLKELAHNYPLIIEIFASMPLELKQVYSLKLAKLLSPEDPRAICSGYYLGHYVRLLPHLTDEGIAILAEKYSLSFLSSSKKFNK